MNRKEGAYLISLCVESVFESDHIWMEELLHDLKFSVLVPLILVDLLDSYDLASLSDSCLNV
jgi:hypothetical protein